MDGWRTKGLIVLAFAIGAIAGFFLEIDLGTSTVNRNASLRLVAIGTPEDIRAVRGVRITELVDGAGERNSGFFPMNNEDIVFPHVVPSTFEFVLFGGPCAPKPATVTISEAVKKISVFFHVTECHFTISLERA